MLVNIYLPSVQVKKGLKGENKNKKVSLIPSLEKTLFF